LVPELLIRRKSNFAFEAITARLEDVLQGGEVSLELTTHCALDPRLGELEKAAWFTCSRQPALESPRPQAQLEAGLPGSPNSPSGKNRHDHWYRDDYGPRTFPRSGRGARAKA